MRISDAYRKETSITFTMEMADYVGMRIETVISSTINYPITFIVPCSFFILSKKNRKMVFNDLKRFWKFIRCNHQNAIIPVSGSD